MVHFHQYQDAADCREQTFFLLKSFDTLLENFSAHICPGLVVICFVTKTRPVILFMNYQMSRKKRKDPVGSTLRYDMMSYKVIPVDTNTWSAYGDTSWYVVVLGHCKLVLLGTWWYSSKP